MMSRSLQFAGVRPAAGDKGHIDAIEIGSADELGLVGSSFTVEAWVNPGTDDPGSFDMGVVGTPSGGNRKGLHLNIRSNKPYLGFWGDDTAGRRVLQTGQWYHVAWRFRLEDGTQAMFVNGVLDAFDAGHQPFQGVGNAVSIGVANGAHDGFVGQISEVRIWDSALSDPEIRARWSARLTGNETRLTSYWPMSEGKGVPTDLVRKTKAEMVGKPTWVAGDMPVVREESKPVALFDGAGSIVVQESERLLGEGREPFSVEAWVRPAAVQGPLYMSPVVSQHGFAAGWELRANSDGCEMLVTTDRVHITAPSAIRLQPDVWHHLLGIFDGSNVHILVNGLRAGSQATKGVPTPYAGPVTIGANRDWPDRRFRGAIAGVRIWSSARSIPPPAADMYRIIADRPPGLAVSLPLSPDQFDSSLTVKGVRSVAVPAPPIVGFGAADASDVPSVGGIVAPDPGTMRLTVEIARLQTVVNALQAKAAALEVRASQADRLQQQLDMASAKNEQLKGDLSNLQQAGQLAQNETTLDVFVKGLNDRIRDARNVVSDGGGPYRLGRVKMQVKYVPGSQGKSLIFPAEGEVDGSQLSTIDLDFDAVAELEAPPPQLEIPDIVGYTEIKARRELVAAGYVVDVSYQAIDDEGDVDRVVSQHPAAGSSATSGTTVMIFIGKQS